MKKSKIAGILFGVAMGVLFSVSLGTVGFVLGASFANLGMVMFKGLDDPCLLYTSKPFTLEYSTSSAFTQISVYHCAKFSS